MTASTPPDELETGQLNVETLDQVAPRLRRFTERLVAQLRATGLEVVITSVYLLNSTDHPIDVPCSANGVPIQMNFDATLPVWAPDPRARLQVSFNHGRRYFYQEIGKTVATAAFPTRKVMARFLREIQAVERTLRIKGETDRKRLQARQALKAFGEDIGLSESSDPELLQAANFKVKALSQTPTRAAVLITVPYDQAAEIVRKYRNDDSV